MRAKSLVITVLALAAATASACRWDSDTLAEERAGVPGLYETITGYFPRHSEAFYRWRVAQAQAAIDGGDHSLIHYDDLAVAYEKLGRIGDAIGVIEAKAKLQPDVYETEANWGTFLVHRGEWEAGLEHLRRAVAINPNAHFGREEYQIMLVEFLILQQRIDAGDAKGTRDFSVYVRDTKGITEVAAWEGERQRAIEGIRGMIRFGQYNSPHLLQAMGDLLARGRNVYHHLAAVAYLHASRVAPNAEHKARSEARALAVVRGIKSRGPLVPDRVVERLRTSLDKRLARGDEKQKQVAADEARWIGEGLDVAAMYDKTYRVAATAD